MLSIQCATVYKHQTAIKKLYAVHGSINLMRAIIAGMAKKTSHLVLTQRGKDVFELILEGKTINEIAELLCISHSGVLRHREKMLEQNGCHSMNELVAKYYGLLSDFLPDIPI